MLEKIKNGEALKKFKELIQNQSGDVSYIDNIELFKKAKYILPVLANKSGYVKTLNAKNIGEISVALGAGRTKKEDTIDPIVGIVLKKKIGDKVESGEVLAYIHASNEEKGNQAVQKVLNSYLITEEKIEKKSSILKIV